MAVPARPEENQSLDGGLPDPLEEFTELQRHAIKLYGMGVPRSKIARALVDYLAPDPVGDRPMDQRYSRARAKLRRWECSQKFRDQIWNKAVVDLDLAMPGVLKGVAAKARRGRVDAAKLVLEVTGRHAPKGEGTTPNIVVAINGIPRPVNGLPSAEIIDVEAEEDDE